MSWILLLIQLIPMVIKIVQAIRELIAELPHGERKQANVELVALARRHIRRRRGVRRHPSEVAFAGENFALQKGESDVVADLETMLDGLCARVGVCPPPRMPREAAGV